MNIIIPQKVITSFLYHAVNNFSEDGSGHVETLAFLVGKLDGNEITATEIMFPQQQGTSGHVDDSGMDRKK